jgi:homogentisate 1,2-dioxygenase
VKLISLVFLCRDDLVDNFSSHKEEVERLLAEGVKKMGISK